MPNQIISGVTSDGNIVNIAATADGKLIVSGSGSGSENADTATATNQAAQTKAITDLSNKLPTNVASDRITPYAPSAVQLSDGANFYQGATQNTLLGIDGKLAFLETELANKVNSGVAIDGQSLPGFASGFAGWLSFLYKLISDRLPTLVNGKAPVITTGTVDVSNLPLTTPSDDIPTIRLRVVDDFAATESTLRAHLPNIISPSIEIIPVPFELYQANIRFEIAPKGQGMAGLDSISLTPFFDQVVFQVRTNGVGTFSLVAETFLFAGNSTPLSVNFLNETNAASIGSNITAPGFYSGEYKGSYLNFYLSNVTGGAHVYVSAMLRRGTKKSIQPISATTLPLPNDAATESSLAKILAEGSEITGQALPSGSGFRGWISNIYKLLSDRLPILLPNGKMPVEITGENITANVTFPSNQNVNITNSSVPVSGTVTVSSGTVTVSNPTPGPPATQPVSAVSLPLPSGAATDLSVGKLLTEGTDIGVYAGKMPPGGTGARGWLSTITFYLDRIINPAISNINITLGYVQNILTSIDARLSGTSGGQLSNILTSLGSLAKKGVAGSPSNADVVAIQGVTGGTPLNVSAIPAIVFGTDTIAAIGVGTTYSASSFTSIICRYTIASIGTNATVRLEGSDDGSSWFNLDVSEVDTTRTANGTYSFVLERAALMFIRFNFVGQIGTTATITTAFIGKP